MAGFWDSFAPQASADAAAGGLGMLQGLIQGPQVAQKMDAADLHNALLKAQAMLMQKKSELAGGPQLMKFAPGSTIGTFDPRSKTMGPLTTLPNPGVDARQMMSQLFLEERKRHNLETEGAASSRINPYSKNEELRRTILELHGYDPVETPPDPNHISSAYQLMQSRAGMRAGATETGKLNAQGTNPYAATLKPGLATLQADVGRPLTAGPLTVEESQAQVNKKQGRAVELVERKGLAEQRVRESAVLPPADANTLGVPYGTPQSGAYGLQAIKPGQREALSAFDQSQNIVSDIAKYSVKVNSFQSGAANRLGGGLANTWGALTQTNQDASMLQVKAGELSMVIRALGEKGALAEGDVRRGAALIPNNFDSINVAMQKVKDLRDLFIKGKESYVKSLSPNAGGAGLAKPGPTLSTSPTESLYQEYQQLLKQGIPEAEARRRIGAKFLNAP